jgi:hypothetical protein
MKSSPELGASEELPLVHPFKSPPLLEHMQIQLTFRTSNSIKRRTSVTEKRSRELKIAFQLYETIKFHCMGHDERPPTAHSERRSRRRKVTHTFHGANWTVWCVMQRGHHQCFSFHCKQSLHGGDDVLIHVSGPAGVGERGDRVGVDFWYFYRLWNRLGP